jgi:hypothetical protein
MMLFDSPEEYIEAAWEFVKNERYGIRVFRSISISQMLICMVHLLRQLTLFIISGMFLVLNLIDPATGKIANQEFLEDIQSYKMERRCFWNRLQK